MALLSHKCLYMLALVERQGDGSVWMLYDNFIGELVSGWAAITRPRPKLKILKMQFNKQLTLSTML